jgi:hypothetical protein
LEDAQGRRTWLTDKVGDEFTLVTYGVQVRRGGDIAESLSSIFPTKIVKLMPATDPPAAGQFRHVYGVFVRQYGAEPGTVYLFPRISTFWRAGAASSSAVLKQPCGRR